MHCQWASESDSPSEKLAISLYWKPIAPSKRHVARLLLPQRVLIVEFVYLFMGAVNSILGVACGCL